METDDLVEDKAFAHEFNSGVFALATSAPRALLAVGLASGAVLVYQTRNDGNVNWARPRWKCATGDEIVRTLLFLDNGQQLIAATWDGRLLLFSLQDRQCSERLAPAKCFAYGEELWQPSRDIGKIIVDTRRGLGLSREISSRMKHYLQLVSQASEENDLHAE